MQLLEWKKSKTTRGIRQRAVRRRDQELLDKTQPAASGSVEQDHGAISDNTRSINHGGALADNGIQPSDLMDIDEQPDNIYDDHIHVDVNGPLGASVRTAKVVVIIQFFVLLLTMYLQSQNDYIREYLLK